MNLCIAREDINMVEWDIVRRVMTMSSINKGQPICKQNKLVILVFA